jgi:hypothetical protein
VAGRGFGSGPCRTPFFRYQRAEARRLFEDLVRHADRETLLMLNPLLARLGESPTRRR